jgi:hypothetical protein
LKVPSFEEARVLLAENGERNPGPWVEHCRVAAGTARAIAERDRRLDPDVAYVLGLLHDVGRGGYVPGRADLFHLLDGYALLRERGYEDAARICLTHSFPIKLAEAFATPWGPHQEEKRFVQGYLDSIEYTPYDRLIQLCDALSLATGAVLMEKRLVDVALRHGFNEHTLAKWRAYAAIREEFDAACGGSIYDVIPGVVEQTFRA